MFQSPIHRVNGCNGRGSLPEKVCGGSFSPLFIGSMAATASDGQHGYLNNEFQSPIHRVNGCNKTRSITIPTITETVSVPYSSGQWLQHHGTGGSMGSRQCFSPLFIGSMAATVPSAAGPIPVIRVSVPYSSGQWLQLPASATQVEISLPSFSPLFIGSMAAT